MGILHRSRTPARSMRPWQRLSRSELRASYRPQRARLKTQGDVMDKCVICCVFESDTTPVEGFFLGIMCCVSKSERYSVTPSEVWDRTLKSLCSDHRAAYEAVDRHAENPPNQ